MKTITVYYGYYGSLDSYLTQIETEEPQPVLPNFIKNNPTNTLLYNCPAVKDFYKNTFSVKSYLNFSIRKNIEQGFLECDQQDKFFSNYLQQRDANLFNTDSHWYFITEEKELLMSQVHPTLADNDISKNTITVEGVFDIGKWMRSLHHNFWLKHNDVVQFKEDDDCFYIKFDTDKKIVFKKFYLDNELYIMLQQYAPTRKSGKMKPKKMQFYYDLFFKHKKYKQKIIKKIKQNLME